MSALRLSSALLLASCSVETSALLHGQAPEPAAQEHFVPPGPVAQVPVCKDGHVGYVAYVDEHSGCNQYCVPEGSCDWYILSGKMWYLHLTDPGDCRVAGFTETEGDKRLDVSKMYLAQLQGRCKGMTLQKFHKPAGQDEAVKTPPAKGKIPWWPAQTASSPDGSPEIGPAGDSPETGPAGPEGSPDASVPPPGDAGVPPPGDDPAA